MKRKLAYFALYSGVLLYLFCMGNIVRVAAQNYTSQYYIHLFNSLIDNTPIGATTPSTGYFSTVRATGNDTASTAQGAYLGWNKTGGVGETDIVNLKGSGVGGVYFYNGVNMGALTLIGHLTPSSLFIPGFTLATAPSTCSNQSATGIDVHGDAVCAGSASLSANGYEVLPSGRIHEWGHTGTINDGCSPSCTSVSFPLTFPNAAFSVTVADDFASGNSRIISVTGKSSAAFTLNANGSGDGAYWQADGW